MNALSENSRAARTVAGSLEAVAGQVYFSRECHANYEALGFPASPTEVGGVPMPEMAAYFTSRGSVMGHVPGEVVAAAFGVFKPAIVVDAVSTGWSITDAATIEAARTDGAVAQLQRILGDSPDGLDVVGPALERTASPLQPAGKPLFAGLQACNMPDEPLAAAWRRADLLREYRGDAHVAAWTRAGFDACQIGVLTELFWGLPNRSYSRTRGWNEADYQAAETSLTEAGLFSDGQLTDEGRRVREAIEVDTDEMCRPIVDGLGADLDRVTEILGSWSAKVREAAGYPASGPIELADAASRG